MHILDRDVWLEIFDSVRRHKLRATLTAFGVFWGIFMLVNLLAAGNGLRNGADASMGGVRNTVFLWSGRPTSIPYKGLTIGRYIRLNDGDINAIRGLETLVDVVAPNNGVGDQFLSYKNKGDTFQVNGVWPERLNSGNFKLLEGRFLNALDLKEARKTIVIGRRVREILFEKNETVIGQRVKILGAQYQVVGVMEPSALNDWAQRDLRRVYMPQFTLRKAFNQGDSVHSMMLQPLPNIDAEMLEQKVIALLQSRHRIHPDDKGVIGSWNSQKRYQQVQGLFSGLSIFSWFVAVGTIIAGVVGVGNIMLITVKERTKEIGIRKAMGATPAAIVSSILQESLVITFFAGYLGLVVGVVVVEIVGSLTDSPNTSFMNPEISFSTAIWAIIVLLIAGGLASILPALKAAKVDPVVALQDE